ncbi:MAG: thioredoxin family protein [Clostridia bacterium]|nr:thioredoxin family protein [Clostridia bacterium]
MIENWNGQRFKDEIFVSGKLAGVEFYSDTCPACRTLGAVLDRVAESYKDRMAFGKVNVNSEEALAERYAIRSVPTFMVFCEGRGVSERVGAVGQRELSGMIDAAIEKTEGKK